MTSLLQFYRERKGKKKDILKIIDCAKVKNYHEKVGMDKNSFNERSYLMGNTLIIGIYKNKQRRELSYHHELGHFVMRKHYLEKVEQEVEAWKFSLKESKIKNISRENVLYILNCLSTYIPWKNDK